MVANYGKPLDFSLLSVLCRESHDFYSLLKQNKSYNLKYILSYC